MCKLYLYILLIFLSINSIDSFTLNAFEQKQVRILNDIKRIEKNNKKVSFTGSIKIPENFECSHFHICYNGKIVKIKNDSLASFTIKDFDSNNVFMLFVSPDDLISSSEYENNIFKFKLKKNSTFKFYFLQKISNSSKDSWGILSNDNLDQVEIPINTFIILLDPESIEFSLENVSWKKNSLFVEIPKIIIKKVVDKAKLTKSCISFMNIKPFHNVQDKKEIISKKNVKISMLL